MDIDNTDEIIFDFKKNIKNYENCESSLKNLIEKILSSSNLNIHSISSRLKSIEVLKKKIEKKKKYASINEITDLVGIRIILYFENEIDIIADIISNEFKIDPENSIDKRITENDRFGYKSLHFVAEFSDERLKLIEYSSFAGVKFEIQIRSILQHSWAEIEHDIGYKGEYEIPDIAKRAFSRIAALLETADIEFVRLKELLDNYEQETKHRLDINIDGVTIKNYITSSTVVEAQNKIFAKVHKFTGPERFFVSPDNGLIIKNLKNLNINTIFELNNLLIKYEKNILKLFKSKFQDKLATSVNKAAPIIQLTDYLESINYSGRP